jgi:hypothetical protein
MKNKIVKFSGFSLSFSPIIFNLESKESQAQGVNIGKEEEGLYFVTDVAVL